MALEGPNVGGKRALRAALRVAADAHLFDEDNIVSMLKVSNERRCE
jgi:hypothetical protein